MKPNIQLHKIEQWLHGETMEARKYVGKRDCNRGDGGFAHHPDGGGPFLQTCMLKYTSYIF